MWSTLVVVSSCLVVVLCLLFVPFFSVEFHGFFFGGAFSFFPCCPFGFLFCFVRVYGYRVSETENGEEGQRSKKKDEEKGRREIKRDEGRRKMEKEKEEEEEEDQN